MIRGVYLSGQGVEAHEATLLRDGERVEVRHAGLPEGAEPLSVAVAEVRVTERLKGVPRRVLLGRRGVFETRDDEGVERVFETEPLGGYIALLERSRQAAIWGVAVLAGLSFLGNLVLLPLAARLIAEGTPQRARELLDDSYVSSLRQLGVLERSSLTAEETAPFSPVLEEVARESGLPSVQIELADSRIGANALALPGGRVIVTSDLVRLVSPEELRAVLYHELGHVKLNHGLEAIVKQAGVSLFLMTLFGFNDINALTQTLLTSTYSRDAEREADRFAAMRLRAEGRSPRLLATALQKLERSAQARGAEEGAEEQAEEQVEEQAEEELERRVRRALWSSHPLTDERVRSLMGEGQGGEVGE
ncbi:MAG: M48 family metallopeptidase [Deltaproteobacteria bacterium]|nr:M48 family metallopeptidase [Deltaproteobacteria bacterium]